MMIKRNVKFKRVDAEGKTRRATVTIYGRTEQELVGRIEKRIFHMSLKGWEVR